MTSIAWASNGQMIPGGGNILQFLMPLFIIIVIFYFLLWMPQKKRQREHQEMIKNLKVGDRIVTNGGVYGTISKVKTNYVEIEVEDKAHLRIRRSAVSELRPSQE